MCGIALILGPGADARAFRRMLAALAHRGEAEEVLCAGDLLAGTQRLRIADRRRAVEPWVSPDGRRVLCFNGEIFNHSELRPELAVLGRGSGSVYLGRDPLGVKPLYWSRSDGCLLVASEVKALVPSGGQSRR